MAAKQVLLQFDFLGVDSLIAPPLGYIGFGAKSDGLYQLIGGTELKLATSQDLTSKLDYLSYTAADVLTKIKTVDGSGSGIDADLLDGKHASSFSLNGHTHSEYALTTALASKLDSSSYTATDILTKIKTVDGENSGLDADTLDGSHASSFSLNGHTHSEYDSKLDASAYTAADVLTKIKTVHGVDSGLNADLLDGNHASAFSLSGHTHSQYATHTSLNSYLPLAGGNVSSNLNVAGKLGVGTTSTSRKLTVFEGGSSNYQMRIGAADAYSYDLGRSSTTGYLTFYGNQSGAIGYSFTGADGSLMSMSNAGMWVDKGPLNVSNGGLTIHSGALNVNAGQLNVNNGGLYVAVGASIYYGATISGGLTVYSGLSVESGNSTMGGNLLVAGEVTAYTVSDVRLKDNIKPLCEAVSVLDKLRPVSYTWNDKAKALNQHKTDKVDVGLIAQEVEEVLPDVVHGIYSDQYKAVDYPKLIPYLLQAVKELNHEIKELKKLK